MKPEMTKAEISAIIQKNLGFRMALIVASPTAWQENAKMLADVLADDIIAARHK